MTMYVYKGQGYCSFMAYDSALKLFTPIFTDGTGLAKFKTDVADPWEIRDVNVPSDVSAHVLYHDALDLLIKAIEPSFLRKTLDLGHGHISVAGLSVETILNVVANFSIFPKKPRLIPKQAYIELIAGIQKDNGGSDGSASSSNGP